MTTRRVLLACALLGLVVLALSAGVAAAPSDQATYVGDDGICQTCHSSIHKAWAETTHGNFIKDVTKDPKAVGGSLEGKVTKMLNFGLEDVQYALLGKPGLLKVQELVGKKGAFGVPPDDYPVLWASWDFGKGEWIIEHEGIGEGTPWLSTCAGCHVTGLQVPTKANPTVTRSFVGFGIGCESCHGPASEHVADPSKENIVVSYDASDCGQCHTRGAAADLNPAGKPFGYPYKDGKQYRPDKVLADYYTPVSPKTDAKAFWPTGHASNSHHLQYPEWLTSAHATALDSLRTSDHARDNCLECHSTDYLLAPKDAKPTVKTAKVGITCQACHASHDPAGNEGLLRMDEKELCESCHNAEGAKVGQAVHHPQAELFEGTLGVGLDKTPMPDTMAQAGVTCVGCHMPETAGEKASHYMKIVKPADGIKYNMPDSCSGCHPGASKQWLQAKLDEWQGTVTAKMARVKAKLDAMKADFAGYPAYKEALFNYQIVEADGSKGAHNFKAAMKLLEVASEKLEGLK